MQYTCDYLTVCLFKKKNKEKKKKKVRECNWNLLCIERTNKYS